MKPITVGMLAIMLGFSVLSESRSFGADITIFDQNIGASTNTTYNQWWNTGNEDQEVEPGNLTGQGWDLEAMLQTGEKLTVAGGFNFLTGNSGYLSGDLFFDTTGDAIYGSSIATSGSNGYRTVENQYGYDYVYKMDFTNLTYGVYEINATTLVQTSYYGSNFESNPFRYVSGGNYLGSGNLSYVSGVANSGTTASFGVALAGGSHNAFTVDLGFLPFDADFLAHFTLGCGNDSIIGQGTTPVPEPGTMMLLGTGLIGLSSFVRKNLRRN